MRDSDGTALVVRRPGALHCAVVTTARIYVTRLLSDAILSVHACAGLVCLRLRQEAATLPSTTQIALIDLLRLILPLMLASMVLTWPL